MTFSVQFTVPGQPVPKGRPRFARRGKFVATYTPEKTVSYENLVKYSAMQAMGGRKPIDGPAALHLWIDCEIPQSWSKKRRLQAEAGMIAATKKPDAENIQKACCDAMNAVVYADDSQLVSFRVEKRYSHTPGVTIRVTELALEPA